MQTRVYLTRTYLSKRAVDGETNGGPWSSAFEFRFGNSESIVCRPTDTFSDGKALPIEMLSTQRLHFLAPMSGLASEEAELQPGRISVLIGEGQTAQVLRNLCLSVADTNSDSWRKIATEMQR